MKKINWGFIVMFIVIALATMTGAYFMEDYWCESETALIWVTGMICVTVMYVANQKRKIAEKMAEKPNQIEKS